MLYESMYVATTDITLFTWASCNTNELVVAPVISTLSAFHLYVNEKTPSESTNVCDAFNVCPCVGVIFEIITLPDGGSLTGVI